MLQNWRTWVLACLSVIASGSAYAYGQIGDMAEELQVSEWVKGGPVTLAEGRGTNVYLLEGWASWCGWCNLSTPMLTYLQQHYGPRGLVVVGVNVWEPAADGRAYVEAQGNRMDYAVAIDSADHFFERRYMAAYGFGVIPNAYVVDKYGRVVWKGAPYSPDGQDINASLLAMIESLLPVTIPKPTGGFVEEGQRHTFSLTVPSYLEPVGYQWRKDGVAIPGATESTYTIDACMPEDGGKYDCILTPVPPEVPILTEAATLSVYPVGSLPVAGLPGLMALVALVGVAGSIMSRRRPA